MDVFYFEIPKLIDQAQVESLLYTKTVINKETGIPELDEYAISDEDEALVRIQLENAAVKIYELTSPYARNIDGGGFFFGASVTNELGLEVQDCVIFRCIFPPKFDKSVIPSLDNVMKNAMVNYTVSQFFYKNNIDGSAHKAWFEENLNSILGFVNRRIGLVRTYKFY